jgi:HTH-type transcriptional regulator/antitoxin HigA
MKYYPIAPPDPIDAIQFRMEQMGMTNADLVKYLGSQSRVSEVLNRKRNLTLKMIKSLYRDLKIPAEVLLA